MKKTQGKVLDTKKQDIRRKKWILRERQKRKKAIVNLGYLRFKNRKNKDRIKGGYADGIPDNKFNKNQLRKGIKVEMEHTNNPKIAKEIAKDHLVEIPNYYTHLEKMEKNAKKLQKNKKGVKNKKKK